MKVLLVVRSGNHCGGLYPGSTEGRKKTQAEEEFILYDSICRRFKTDNAIIL